MTLKCGLLDNFKVNNWVKGNTPAIQQNEMFAKGKFTSMKLSEGSLKILRCPNAGGNSIYSEVLSFELMCQLFQATLQRTEMEIQYYPSNYCQL
jgi:hypothetical protein